MSGKDPTKKLLQYAIEAGSTCVDDPNANSIASDSDRKWLNEAVKDISSAYKNLVKRLKECLEILIASELDNSISVDDLEATLEEIASLCEDIDLACDLHKIGGFEVVLKFLRHTNLRLGYAAANVIAVVSQNNEYCQNVLLKADNLLEILLEKTLTHNTDEEKNIATKSMYALSCLVRHNKTGIEKFISHNGFSYILRGIQSDVAKLRVKSMFLLSSLSKESYEILKFINTNDFAAALLKAFNVDDDLGLIEYALETLIAISCHNVEFRNKCKENAKDYKHIIGTLLLNTTIKEDHPEIVRFCVQLYEILNLQNE